MRSDLLPATIVVAFNRPDSLIRLLRSVILAQEVTGRIGPIVVSVDGGTPEVVAAAASFHDSRIETVAQPRHLGLFEHVLTCGDLTERYGPILLLEDDLILSPAAFAFIMTVLPEVTKQSRVAALSLYSFDFNEFSGRPLHKSDYLGDLFYARTGSSWGQVWWPAKWQEFRHWLRDEYDASHTYRVPSRVSQWPDSSWKRLFNFFLSSKGYYSAIPKESFALNEGTVGTNHLAQSAAPYSTVRSLVLPSQAYNLNEATKLDEFLELETDDIETIVSSCGVRTSEIEFDIFGTKRKDDINKEYVYTARQQNPDKVIAEFDGNLGNALLVLICGIDGSGLSLVRRDDFDDKGKIPWSHQELRNYCRLENRQLLRVAAETTAFEVKEKIRKLLRKRLAQSAKP